jgi:Fe-coproporphyrin III synthase
MPIVILYVTEGCNLHCCMCSYRHPHPGELSLGEISSLADRLAGYGLRHIVYSGGEPLLRRDFPAICDLFGRHRVKQTLLTNGLLLEKRLPEIGRHFREIIVSLDGPDAPTHDAIRGVSFEQAVRGIESVRTAALPGQSISLRTVVQKRNFRALVRMVDTARSLGVRRISFLAADVLSGAFGRDASGSGRWNQDVLLDGSELEELRQLVNLLISTRRQEFEEGFISESPAKLYRIVEYFEALAGKRPFPRNLCNAPNVSAVITSSGEIQPCFFLPAFGNVRGEALKSLSNGPSIRLTRRNVKAYSLERCKTCVCTLNVSPAEALLDRF